MDIYEAIHQRRSHRMYKPEMPPKAALDRVIDAALWAPSGTNAQAWEITVMAGKVRDEFVELVSQATKFLLPELKKAGIPEKGQEFVMKFFKNLGGAPVVIAVTIDKNPDTRHANGQHPERRRPVPESAPGGPRRRVGDLLDDRRQLPGKRNFEVTGERGQATPGHHPHRLLRQGAAGAAPESARSALAGVLSREP